MAHSYVLCMDKRRGQVFSLQHPHNTLKSSAQKKKQFPSLSYLAAEVVIFPEIEPLDRSDFWTQSLQHQDDLIQRSICLNHVRKSVRTASVHCCRFWLYFLLLSLFLIPYA
ncbi:hypothetical protein HanIR_Chr15g0780421 [Helianthus annuus]|nr:hypothetical protein HanIR_Chr15g0780421 [Helianthus annuus]